MVGILNATDTEKSMIRIQIQIRNPEYESKDPDPSHNVTDPEHWCRYLVVNHVEEVGQVVGRDGEHEAGYVEDGTCARNYRHSFRENKPKTLVFYD